MNKLHLLLDLDGQYLGGSLLPGVNHSDLATLHDYLARKSQSLRISFITGRAVPEVRVLTFLLPETLGEVHLAELGTVAWIPARNRYEIHPDCLSFASSGKRSELMKFLSQDHSQTGLNYQLLPSRVVTLALLATPGEEITLASELRSRLVRANLLGNLRLQTGLTVELVPGTWDKLNAMPWFEQLCLENRTPIEWFSTLWVADRMTDAGVARLVRNKGGRVACPGNADLEYQDEIRHLNGFVASGSHQRGMLEILQAHLG